jgi:DNA polymerase-3 subunit gamma/tau
MALNCEQKRPDHEPCGECPSCQRIWSGGASLDVIEMDAASNRGVDDARELRERAMYAPSGDDRHKIYILDEAHMLTREAWNTLLKVLEEPPPRVIFVFATTDPQKIQQAAAPVLSRVQRFDLRRIGPAEVRERLRTVLAAEGITAEPEALAMLARAADGSMRDALSLTDQALSLGGDTLSAERVREALGLVHEEEHLRLLELVAQRQAGEVFAAVARLADHGVDFSVLLTDFANILRAQLAVVLGGTLPDLSDRVRDALAARTGDFSAGDLLRMLHLVSELEPHLRRSGQQQILLETLLVRCALLDRTLDLEQVLRDVSGSGGVPRAAAPRASSPTASSPTASAPRASAPRASAPVVSVPPVVADRAPTPTGPRIPLDLNRLVECWEEITDAVHGEHGALMLSSTLAHATPSAVTASGTVTLTVTSEAHAELIAGGEATVLAAVRRRFDGVQALAVRVEAPDATRAPRRLNEGAVKADRMTMLRKQSPLLDAAVEALDLELLD